MTPNSYISERQNVSGLILDLLNSKQKNLKANLGSQQWENGLERQPSREGLWVTYMLYSAYYLAVLGALGKWYYVILELGQCELFGNWRILIPLSFRPLGGSDNSPLRTKDPRADVDKCPSSGFPREDLVSSLPHWTHDDEAWEQILVWHLPRQR